MAHRVCPWWLGYLLASPLRRLAQSPGAIVGPFVAEGMTVLEPGPGMGFFTLELARRVGPGGKVVAVDVQEKMIQGLIRRATKAGLQDRIDACVTTGDRLGIGQYTGKVDFALAFAVVHEVANPQALLQEICSSLKTGSKLLLAEPTGHVGAQDFQSTLRLAQATGLIEESRPVIWRSRAAVLVKTPS